MVELFDEHCSVLSYRCMTVFFVSSALQKQAHLFCVVHCSGKTCSVFCLVETKWGKILRKGGCCVLFCCPDYLLFMP